MVSSECEPFAKTGGLADVVDALARALGELGHEVDVYLPRYRGLQPPGSPERSLLTVPQPAPPSASDTQGSTVGEVVEVLTARADGYRLRLVDHAASLDRAGYYGEGGSDYPDNGARFALLGRAALEAIRAEGGGVAVLHGHDWPAGPAVLLRDFAYGADPALTGMATMVTCHNLAYHGWVPREQAWALGLPADVGTADGVDLLREEVARADIVNTVSPNYAAQSMKSRVRRWPRRRASPEGRHVHRDPQWHRLAAVGPRDRRGLTERFSSADPAGKLACKRDLAFRLGIDVFPAPGDARGARDDGRSGQGDDWGERGAPLFGMVGRLDPQKGLDLLAGAAETMLEDGARIVVLGTGDGRLVRSLQLLAARRPDRVAILDRFDRDEARRIYAGSDLLLMPSWSEPCGQSQMLAMRYGTIPIVRSTGGLADTVTDADARPDEGDGFVFLPAEPSALAAAARHAIVAYHDECRWRVLVARAMHRDFSWAVSAPRYVEAYERAVAIRLRSERGVW